MLMHVWPTLAQGRPKPLRVSRRTVMKSWGFICLALGVGSFILPKFGVQFILLSWAGSGTPVVGGLLILMGVALLAAGWHHRG
jgi:hypothetical protein